MATITGYTAERMLEIENKTVIAGSVKSDGNLYLKTRDGDETNAGYVRGPKGDTGDPSKATLVEARTGTDNTRYITPYTMAEGFPRNFSNLETLNSWTAYNGSLARLNGTLYVRSNGAWVRLTDLVRQAGPSTYRGTTSERNSKSAMFGDIWYDTTDSKVYKGRTNGSWTQLSGRIDFPEASWDHQVTSIYARSATQYVPTILESNETLEVTSAKVGTGFAFVSTSTVAPEETQTLLVCRFAQLLNASLQPFSVNWRIIDI